MIDSSSRRNNNQAVRGTPDCRPQQLSPHCSITPYLTCTPAPLQYNTCFWALVQQAGMTNTEAQAALKARRGGCCLCVCV